MFDWLKSKIAAPEAEPKPAAPEVLGLRLGGAVELNELKLRLLDDQLITDNIAKTQLIQAVGQVKLDASNTILRFYTDDEAFFQVVMTGGVGDEFVSDVKLFHFYSTVGVNSRNDWEKTLRDVSQPSWALEEKSFQRVWGAVGDNPPMAMTEETFTQDSSGERTDQFIMLYELATSAELSEFVLVSAEEKIINHQHDRCLVISTGINLGMADFEVIG
ncbi:YjfK family protein [Pokkaliibacter sp. CJK22405]|uniref:YjfK family protein n=1 Tax=Pokkaliibacter sp. CJK22405 TaxID=3384615 RepID=UPI003985041C